MVGNVTDFPSKGGVSETMIPISIVLGKLIPDYKTKRIYFGYFSLVYIGTTNSMKIRSVPVIALRDSNQYGGHYSMSLYIRKNIHGYHWGKIPIYEGGIQCVEDMAQTEKQHLLPCPKTN